MMVNDNSSMTLDQFMEEMHDDLIRFKNHWIEQNKIEPEFYPMEFDKDDTGQWMQQFLAFIDFFL